MMEGSLISEEEEAKDGLRGFQEVSSQEPALRRLRNLSDQEERRGRAQSFSLNRNLCSERERANSFTHNKSHNYLERVKMRRSQQAVHSRTVSFILMTHCLCFRFLSCSVWSRRRRRPFLPPVPCCPPDPRKCHLCPPSHQSSQDPPHYAETRHQTSHSSLRLPLTQKAFNYIHASVISGSVPWKDKV